MQSLSMRVEYRRSDRPGISQRPGFTQSARRARTLRSTSAIPSSAATLAAGLFTHILLKTGSSRAARRRIPAGAFTAENGQLRRHAGRRRRPIGWPQSTRQSPSRCWFRSTVFPRSGGPFDSAIRDANVLDGPGAFSINAGLSRRSGSPIQALQFRFRDPSTGQSRELQPAREPT